MKDMGVTISFHNLLFISASWRM